MLSYGLCTLFQLLTGESANNTKIFPAFFLLFRAAPGRTWHMEVPRLGVESELQLLACTTATAKQDLSRVCNLHHSSWQHQTLNPLSEARDWTHILMDTSWVCYHWATTGTAIFPVLGGILWSIQKFNFDDIQVSNFLSVAYAFGVKSRKPLLRLMSGNVIPVFFFNFMYFLNFLL